jgi:hypothetical protein
MNTLIKVALRLKNYVTELGKQYPQVWQQVDAIRGDCRLRNWKDWCFLSYDELPEDPQFMKRISVPSDLLSATNADAVARNFEFQNKLTALAPWRVTQGIYNFDETVLDALWESAGSDRVPVDVLYRMPEWCVYVATPGRYDKGMPLHGFFATLTMMHGRPQLYLLLDVLTPEGNKLKPAMLALGAEGLAAAWIESSREMDQFLYDAGVYSHLPPVDAKGIKDEVSELMPLVSLVIYICVEASAVRDGSGTHHPTRPHPTRTRRGERFFPPDSPTEWQVAYRLGAALRQAYAVEQEEPLGGTGAGHASPRPHIRRGHWHSFWTGRRSVLSERKLVVKWLPPIAVCVQDVEQLVPTVRLVA